MFLVLLFVLRSYTLEQLVGLGVGWIWMGIDGKDSQYTKLADVDTRQLVKHLFSTASMVASFSAQNFGLFCSPTYFAFVFSCLKLKTSTAKKMGGP